MKNNGESSNLSQLILTLLSNSEIQDSRRYDLLNEVFSLSNESEWVDHVQKILIDVFWLLGKR